MVLSVLIYLLIWTGIVLLLTGLGILLASYLRSRHKRQRAAHFREVASVREDLEASERLSRGSSLRVIGGGSRGPAAGARK